ncbi:MAG: GAF domain-containing sensor histidine kinase [Alicyclobacillaceae bacterium]|nr:GAF domain-containing sensor histidine kinase [Alicyclobacillaceae bacterium]
MSWLRGIQNFQARNWMTHGFGLLGLMCFILALRGASLSHVKSLVLLSILLVALEYFTINFGRVHYSLAFPLLFGFFLVFGVQVTVVCDVLFLLVVQLVRRKPYETVLYNVSTRCIAIYLAGWSMISVRQSLIWSNRPFEQLFVELLVSLVVYSSFLNFVILAIWRPSARWTKSLMASFRAMGVDVLIALIYDGTMLWLARNPNNTSSGSLGTFFFFLPLPAISIVSSLIVRLMQAKSGLESVFAVSQTLNQMQELDMVLEQIVTAAKRLFHSPWGTIYQCIDGGKLEGFREGRRVVLPPGKGLVNVAVEEQRCIISHDVHRDDRFCPLEVNAEVASLFVSPIIVDTQVVGVLSLGKTNTWGFHHQDERLMSIFTSHAGAAMKNALFRQERDRRLLLEERNRMAREIHDGLAQDLAAAILQVEMMKRLADTPLQQSLQNLRNTLASITTTVRESIYSLRPHPYEEVGLVRALEALMDDVTVGSNLNVSFYAKIDQECDPQVARAVYEIVLEGVRNVVKHAQASMLIVELTQTEEGLSLSIRDDGVGFEFGQMALRSASDKSFGIENVHTIAASLGGTLEFLTKVGQGTTILAELPWIKEDNRYDDTVASL